MDKQYLEEYLIQLDVVKNHLREAHKALNEIARQDCKKADLKNPETFQELLDRNQVNSKARDLISAAMFIMKKEIVEMEWRKEG